VIGWSRVRVGVCYNVLQYKKHYAYGMSPSNMECQHVCVAYVYVCVCVCVCVSGFTCMCVQNVG